MENGNNSFMELLKLSTFLNGIRGDLSLDVRKQAPKNFKDARYLVKQIELAYDQSQVDQINALNSKSESMCMAS